MRKAATAGLGAAAVLGVYVRWARPRIFSWGATCEEASRPMAGDELCLRPQLNATRAVTIAAPPEDIWPWLVQWGWNRAGFYSYDLLDNLGRPNARQILPQFQHLQVGDWVPMGGKTIPYTAYQVARLELGTLMLWRKGGGTWLWLQGRRAVGGRHGQHKHPGRRGRRRTRQSPADSPFLCTSLWMTCAKR